MPKSEEEQVFRAGGVHRQYRGGWSKDPEDEIDVERLAAESPHLRAHRNLTPVGSLPRQSRIARELLPTLEPGQSVIINGIPTCHYGICHATLDAAARLSGADFFYIANTRGAPMRSYLGGKGFIPAEELRNMFKVAPP